MKKNIKKLVLCILVVLLLVSGNLFGQRYTGVNWFGFETSNYVVHGIWARDYKSVLQQIKDLGFNTIRLPWCVEMIGKTPSSIQINASGVDAYTGQTGLNLDLAGLDSLQVMDKIIEHCGTLGIYILLDCHSLAAGGYMNETQWYTSAYSESAWISAWSTMANRYKSYANVMGADVKNEPHGNLGSGMKPPATWGYTATGYTNTDWRAAAIRCGQAIQAIAPSWYIVIEGCEMSQDGDNYWWGGNLKDAANYPITGISKPIYSFHEYGSGVYMQSWFSASDFPNNMPAIWDNKFYFIQKNGMGRMLLGEFGIHEANAANTGSIDYKWLTKLMSYLGGTVDWTFWCINPNSGDTGGILKDDWVSVNTAKYNILKPYLAGGSSPTNPPSTAAPTDPPSVTPDPTTPPSVTPDPTTPPTATAAPTDTPAPTSVPTATPAGVTADPTAPPGTATDAPTNPPAVTDPPATGCTCTNLCSSQTAITVPFTKDGAGEFCYTSSSIASYINSWNCDSVNVNGVNCTNTYTASSGIAAIGGVYYIYYKGSYSYSHLEIK